MLKKQVFKVLLVLLISFGIVSSVNAGSEIPSAYLATAFRQGIPPKILYSVAMVESRKVYKGEMKPWPWTLNISGKAFYYKNRVEASLAAETEINKGNHSVAIGLMQIFWRYHKENFRSPYQLLNPRTNLNYGAAYLKHLHDLSGDWDTAVGYYYTGPNPNTDQLKAKAADYAKKVRKQWEKL